MLCECNVVTNEVMTKWLRKLNNKKKTTETMANNDKKNKNKQGQAIAMIEEKIENRNQKDTINLADLENKLIKLFKIFDNDTPESVVYENIKVLNLILIIKKNLI